MLISKLIYFVETLVRFWIEQNSKLKEYKQSVTCS